MPRRLSHKDYHVGWICALHIELAAATCMFDEQHAPLSQPETDHNSYELGRIGEHNVVMAVLPAATYGTTAAAVVAARMWTTFPKISFGLMVGIGGAAPSDKHDIRLGDIVVSQPEGKNGGVIQYDAGKMVEDGRLVKTGTLSRPPPVLLTALNRLKARYANREQQIDAILHQTSTLHRDFQVDPPSIDRLFLHFYDHVDPISDCGRCDESMLIQRPVRDSVGPTIHYGNIASGNAVMRDGITRERIREEHDILCFEMEASGLVNDFPCLVIRGICDYADSHKDKEWQRYASAVAAAYARELLGVTAFAHEDIKPTRRASFDGASSETLVATPTSTASRSSLFYTLDDSSTYLHPQAKGPWQYLTVQAYLRYESMYQSMAGRDGGVPFPSFRAGFDASAEPTSSIILSVWTSLLRHKHNPKEATMYKPLIMAAIYILHVGTVVRGLRFDVDDNRREVLKRFDKWVACRCKEDCPRRWNFANDRGLVQGTAGKPCRIERAWAEDDFGGIRGSLVKSKWEAMKKHWYSSSP